MSSLSRAKVFPPPHDLYKESFRPARILALRRALGKVLVPNQAASVAIVGNLHALFPLEGQNVLNVEHLKFRNFLRIQEASPFTPVRCH